MRFHVAWVVIAALCAAAGFITKGAAFLGDLPANALFTTVGIGVGATLFARYEERRRATRWHGVKRQAFATVARRLCRLIQELHYRYIPGGYINAGVYADQRRDVSSAHTGDMVREYLAAIRAATNDVPSNTGREAEALAQRICGMVDPLALDSLRVALWVLLPAADDEATIGVLQALEALIEAAYGAHDYSTAVRAGEGNYADVSRTFLDFIDHLDNCFARAALLAA